MEDFSNMNDDGVNELRTAVVKQAINDLKFAIRKKNYSEIERLEAWFRSGYLSLYTDLDGEMLISISRKLAQKRRSKNKTDDD